MQDLTIGNILSVEIEDKGNKRAIQDHLLWRLDTIIAKTVLVGSSMFMQVPNSFPVLYEMSGLHEFRPFEQLHIFLPN